MYKNLVFSKEDRVATVTMNRPSALNTLDFDLSSELADCLAKCADDQEIRAVILNGNGRVFCAGGDINAMKNAPNRPYLFRQLTLYVHSAIALIWRMPKPVIAAVHRVAAGAGFPLALACDLIIAAEGTEFGTAYLAIGLSPDGGTTFFLPRVFSLHQAKYLAFTSEMIDTTKGKELGFVNQVVKPEELMSETKKTAVRLASGPILAIARTKELLNDSLNQMLEAQMQAEQDKIAFTSGTSDFDEGISAFLGKRNASFKGQ